MATDCYKQALQCDVYSYQAFEALVQNQMLSAAEGIFIAFKNRLKMFLIDWQII